MKYSFLTGILVLSVQMAVSQTNSGGVSNTNSNSGVNQQMLQQLNQQNNQQNNQQAGSSVYEVGTAAGYVNPLEIYQGTIPSSTAIQQPAKREAAVLSYKGDPTATRMYRLPNGLTVYLSKNTLEPRIQTYIAVRTGSKNDPPTTTGLAHYLEHMMFKGTENIGTSNWEREKIILDGIARLYEEHRQEKDENRKKEIYAEIDRMSQEAAKFAIPNEYDKMIGSLGAKGTNAYTSLEETVYVNDIPSNELEKWLIIESERFHRLVLRLFHTELEAVYEEFNMSQDRDGRKMWKAFMESMFTKHTYGTQTTIGEGEHLKNPSMYRIMEYFSRYYVPNNMAIILSGDLDYDATIDLITKYFGNYEARPVPDYKPAKEEPITSVKRREVYGTEAESMMMGYRLRGSGSADVLKAQMVAALLSNGQAGLFDLDLNQAQKVLSSEAFVYELTDYSMLIMSAEPKEGQTLEACEALLLQQLDRIRKGDFDEWLMDAVVNDMRLSRTKSFESNWGRTSALVDAFIMRKDWKVYLDEPDNMAKLTKKEIMDFASEMFTNENYVIVYKRMGEDKNVEKVDKPAITPVEANRDIESEFLKEWMRLSSSATEPKFVDYKKDIQRAALDNDIPLSVVPNTINDLFELYYVFDMGSDNDLELALALSYLPYLGTNDYSAAALEQEFFKYGLSFNVSVGSDRTYVTLSGLEANMEKGVELLEHILANVKADKDKYEEMVGLMLKERSDAKLNKSVILNRAMASYAQYGPDSRFKHQLSEKELRSYNPNRLIDRVHDLTTYPHEVFYYGNKDLGAVKMMLNKQHKVPARKNSYPEARKFTELPTTENKVYFVHYDMVQAMILRMSKDEQFNKELIPVAQLFNEYFGSGLSSIVFQEIRETRALAYSAYANYSIPSMADDAHYVRSYVATQADKMQDAIEAMSEIMNDMPQAEQQFAQSVEASIKKIQSERVTRSSVYCNYQQALRRGLDYDVRADVYDALQGMTINDLNNFFDEHIADRNYTYLVIGDRSKLDMEYLRSLGSFEELTLEQIFGY